MSHIPSPNLLPQSRVATRKRKSAIRIWSFTLAAMVLLVAIPSALLSVHLRASEPQNNQHITRFVNDLNDLQATLPALKKKVAQLESESKSQELAKLRIHWNSVINQLAILTNENIRIHSFDASIIRRPSEQSISITIQIHTKTLSQAREFLVVLEDSALFDTLKMSDSRKTSSSPDAPVNSTITASIIANLPEGAKP
jgi:Tfp pilus assembly protein PilN